MKKNIAQIIEKWIWRLVVIQLLVLIAAQILMEHRSTRPYLNKAIRYEGVYGHKPDDTTESVDEPVDLWYYRGNLDMKSNH